MTLEIHDPEVDELARELARTTGETVPEAVLNALRERLVRERERQHQPRVLAETILRIGRACAALPVLDERPADEIIGYDEQGLPS